MFIIVFTKSRRSTLSLVKWIQYKHPIPLTSTLILSPSTSMSLQLVSSLQDFHQKSSSRLVILHKLTVPQLFTKFPNFYITQMSITVFTSADIQGKVMLWSRIKEVSGSNLTQGTGFPDWGFSCYSCARPGKCLVTTLRPLPSQSLPSSHSTLHSLDTDSLINTNHPPPPHVNLVLNHHWLFLSWNSFFFLIYHSDRRIIKSAILHFIQ
jgi:hypothetical protein